MSKTTEAADAGAGSAATPRSFYSFRELFPVNLDFWLDHEHVERIIMDNREKINLPFSVNDGDTTETLMGIMYRHQWVIVEWMLSTFPELDINGYNVLIKPMTCFPDLEKSCVAEMIISDPRYDICYAMTEKAYYYSHELRYMIARHPSQNKRVLQEKLEAFLKCVK